MDVKIIPMSGLNYEGEGGTSISHPRNAVSNGEALHDDTVVSVIIPTYKPEQYLHDCLESLARQTRDKDDFEVIIVLNGCKDPYLSEIKHYTHQLKMNCIVVQLDQAGVSNARNIGIEKAKGRYITFLDDDDWVSPNYLENLCEVLKDDTCVAIANVLNFAESSRIFHKGTFSYAYDRCENLASISLLSGRTFFSTSCCKLIPRSIIANRRFDTHLTLGEDALFMASLSCNIKHIKLANPDTLYYVRERADSVSRSSYRISTILCNTVELLLKYLRIYASSPCRYSLLFFCNRLLAVVKNATTFFK